jgi:DNA-binding response OmpR family regulator
MARLMHALAVRTAEGGTMGLESAQSRVASANPTAQRTRTSLVPWRQAHTILLVENDRKTRHVLADCLRREGYRVVEIANGDDALEWLGSGVVDGELERIPDLVVSNVHLPYFDGLDILEQLQVCTRRIPVILITNLPDSETHAEASRLGARSVLAKPFALGELRAAVQRAISDDASS